MRVNTQIIWKFAATHESLTHPMRETVSSFKNHMTMLLVSSFKNHKTMILFKLVLGFIKLILSPKLLCLCVVDMKKVPSK
jgi:hypothetical protein